MGTAMFYHLTQRPLEDTLRMLVGKAQGAGWRVAVRGTTAARMQALDAALWLGPDDSFLAHGVAGGPHDRHQPVLLTCDAAAPNGPQCVMTIDGADLDPAEIAGLERLCVLFDGTDDAAVNKARAQWLAVKNAGCEAQYWSEDSGRWEMKAKTN